MKYVSLDVVSDPIMCEARVLLVVVLDVVSHVSGQWVELVGCCTSVVASHLRCLTTTKP